ncbi:50S ribosomal protein L3 [Sulfolobus acidocaldarius]|uniref:Large ribosomal subunit protein uL3 n=6 Tax=Sulfolobus acidocaldarius TaxID=2285 RepID=RL3_SULAC|nr:50S ribosomal protein L3 [Sulfolobus acidocaldarius]Q4JB40.1 RecName: Full=Large ribosomal subunit protein uL3; AltName: Full=50S ribosomal protein L3 [Sulfolobus acidocaldarius DSM 639]AAY79989.1 50S ribosomal protein L3P [Sulfolobus acidocaldarius DSM 639]AGE70558.1 50S ribosomal protein L3P [Sulfolobus acidocaldarius N8]AGE72831.1 50S ribosomal protein L3P [Sulfolobus acidocaldarius Ron12/I]ALU29083.1 50S ribosomal protein L3 [Sulfolobus acidocaldarius]ALU31809.1 50S ribosomal protein L
MGHRKLSSPRRGSAGLRPRKRADEILPTPKNWPLVNLKEPKLLGFIGYKAGMTHVYMIDDKPTSPNYGKEVYTPVTIVESPPILGLALRAYHIDSKGELSVLVDYWANFEEGSLKYLKRKITSLKVDSSKMKEKLDLIQKNLNNITYMRLLVSTQPWLVPSLGKKRPEIVEIQIGGGSIQDQLNYGLSLLGKQIPVRDVFREGQLTDIIGVTKGKGFQGVIKRYSVVEFPRWHKHRKGSRKIGARGPSISTPSYVPQPGQLGFHRRTEYNKRIIKIGDNVNEINPAGGIVNYGLVKNTYLVIEGSVLGSRKRPLFLRYPIRPSWSPESAPKITYVNLASQQG